MKIEIDYDLERLLAEFSFSRDRLDMLNSIISEDAGLFDGQTITELFNCSTTIQMSIRNLYTTIESIEKQEILKNKKQTEKRSKK